MIHMITKFSQLSFSKLMAVYEQSNAENARQMYPEYGSAGLTMVEQDFYDYIRNCFFRIPGAVYAVLEENGRYISALRLEPYKDGFLLNALETAPQYRGRGYATKLVHQAITPTHGNIYSHVRKDNLPSLRTHLNNGFEKISDSAVYLDGSYDANCVTLLRKG